jgi:hypothetical protein
MSQQQLTQLEAEIAKLKEEEVKKRNQQRRREAKEKKKKKKKKKKKNSVVTLATAVHARHYAGVGGDCGADQVLQRDERALQ